MHDCVLDEQINAAIGVDDQVATRGYQLKNHHDASTALIV
ncbi:2-isopropylmalate synthase [Moritella sp. PE36]|nr:2-isopropylmalate synthase [Moritella sp. PE36]